MLAVTAVILSLSTVFAQNKTVSNSKSVPSNNKSASFEAKKIEEKGLFKSTDEIKWISFSEAEKMMKVKPKKVIIDLYTSWCGWCKVMDKKTYSNPELIKYVNDNYYAIKFDAESRDSISFLGQRWGYEPQYKASRLAVELMGGKMSYPTTVIMGENFQGIYPIPGFLELPVMESILKYFQQTKPADKETYQDFNSRFKAVWVPLVK